jgi:hypothetical protein
MRLADPERAVAQRASHETSMTDPIRPLRIPFYSPEWSGAPEHIFEFWKLTKGARVAVCALWNHPLGAEVRCDVDGEMWRTKASRDLGQLLVASDEWRKAFQAKGWTA